MNYLKMIPNSKSSDYRPSFEFEAHLEGAKEYENDKYQVRTRGKYQVAGELALYEGKLAQIQAFFKKAAEIDPDYG